MQRSSRPKASVAPGHPFSLFHRQGDEYVAYSYANVDMILWREAATGPGARTLNQLTRERIRLGQKHSVVHVVLPTAGVPDAEGRKEFNALAERWSKWFGCIVTVIELEGFMGSAIRGFTTGIHALTSRGTAHKVVQTVEQAAEWMAEPHARATGVNLDPDELRQVFVAMRATIG